MLSILESILHVFLQFAQYIVAGFVSSLNLVFDGISLLVAGLFLLLPSMPGEEVKLSGEVLEAANWFFPFGFVVGEFTVGVTMYVVWLAVRYIYRLVRAA